jgi:serine protease Do
MSAKPQSRIVIRHLSGSKIHQVEEIPLKDLQKLTMGRDPSAGIVYDQRRDDVVSRQHAAIRVESGDELSFRLVDLNSSNGTLLNGERISGEVELVPEDLVELGAGGPKFIFDVQPRPANLAARTRVLNPVDATASRAVATAAMETAEFNRGGTQELATAAETAVQDASAGKSLVGKETVLRMLFQERKKSSRVLMGSIAAVLAVLVIAGGTLFYHNRTVAARMQEEAFRQSENARRAAAANMRETLGASARDIVNKYGNATVLVDFQWRMYDRGTGRPLFQKTILDKQTKELLPAFIRLPNGTIVRWLTLEDELRTNIPVQAAGSGSGFLVNDKGFILTNKHVAAGWMIPYSEIGIGKNSKNLGAIFPYHLKKGAKYDTLSLGDAQIRAQRNWVPEDGGYVFDANDPIAIGGDTDNRRVFHGRNDLLEVRFAGNRVSIQASLLRASTDADAALMKVDTAQPLRPVEIAPEDNKVDVGERVVVLGYPGVSGSTQIKTTSVEFDRTGSGRVEILPEPTVTEGIISLVGAGFRQEGDVIIRGEHGDTYQMSINSTGHGNSGGPVFNQKGQVIGLFTYGISRQGDASVTFAVPIKHGRQLLNPQRL